MKKLVYVLREISGANVGATFLKSGNLLKKLQDLGEDAAIELADTYYKRTAKDKEVFEKGYLLGRVNKTKKPVYRIEFPPNIYFFIGTEADILRKITAYEEEKKGDKEEDKGDTDEEKREYEQTKEELTDLFK
jgi:hypothetical protein